MPWRSGFETWSAAPDRFARHGNHPRRPTHTPEFSRSVAYPSRPNRRRRGTWANGRQGGFPGIVPKGEVRDDLSGSKHCHPSDLGRENGEAGWRLLMVHSGIRKMGHMGHARKKHVLAKTFDSLEPPGVYLLELLGEVCASDVTGHDQFCGLCCRRFGRHCGPWLAPSLTLQASAFGWACPPSSV